MKRISTITIPLLALVGLVLQGQEYRGSLMGRVTDVSEAIVPSADVTVVNESTKVAAATRTNSEGNFLVLLEPGVYTVTVQATGFRKRVSSGVTIRVGDRLTLGFQLEVGSASESITVAAQATQLETTSADIAQVVERRFLDLLYISNRNPLNLLTLTAGVSNTLSGGTLKDPGGFANSEQAQYTINGGGGSWGNNEIIIDGASVVMPRQKGSIASSPSGDAVEEVRVQTTMFDAAYGHTNGGMMTYATRGGTNQLHGLFEGFYRDKVLEANGWTNNRQRLPRADVTRRFYSGAVGGPVYLPKLYSGKNRTFFFFSMQQQDQIVGSTFLRRTLTDLERKGDFSQTLNGQGTRLDIYDPHSTVVSGSKATRQPFAGARIPASALNPTGAAIANVFPLPNLNVPVRIGLQNWGVNSNEATPSKQISVRLDHTLSSRQRLFGRVGIMRNADSFEGIPPGSSITEDTWGHFHTVSLNDDYVFSPTFFAAFRYGFVRYSNSTWASSQRQDPKALKIPDIILQNALFPGWPMISMGENMYGLGGRIKYRANDTHSLVPTLTKLAGSHSVRTGADLRLIHWNSVEPGNDGAGNFSFNNTFTRSDPFTSSTGNTTGTSMASLLLGLPASGNLGGPTPYSLTQYYLAGFVQDDWKVTPRLTLSIGLRYEVETPWRERYDRLAYGFDYSSASPVQVPGLPLRGGLLFAGTAGNPSWNGKIDWNNLGPRFGLAYQLRSSTVIRAGYGLIYASNSGNLDTSISNGVPADYSVAAPYVATTDGGATPFTTISNPYPNGLPAISGNKLGMATRLGSSLSFIDQGRVLAYSQQWQFGIQQALPSRIRLEAAFVRVLSLKGLDSFNLNEKPDRYLTLGSAENQQVPNPFYGILPASTSLGSSRTAVQRQFWLAYPQFTGLTVYGSNTRKTTYHSVQLSMEKRLSHGLTLLANYSGSKLIENNITSLVNTRHYRGIADTDLPYLFNLAYVYDLPFGKGQPLLSGAKGVLGKILGGWATSGRIYMAGGPPLSISDANGRPIRLRNASKSGSIEGRLGDQVDPATKRVLNPYFDTTAFASLPNQYTISPEPPYFAELRAPHRRTMDMSLIKRFSIRERLNIDMRADANNLTNTPQFDPPGTNMTNKATFGVIQSAAAGRSVQFAFRAVF